MRQKTLIALASFCAIVGFARGSAAASLTLAWNPSANATGYTLSFGTQPRVYTGQVNAGAQTQAVVSGLAAGTTYYFAVRASNGAGISAYSQEISWTVAGTVTEPVTNYNLIGHPELVWQSTDGSLVGWFMNGTTQAAATYLNPGRVTDLGWKIVTLADFNRDTIPDILWQNETTGGLVVWFMRGNTMTSAVAVVGVPDLAWKVVDVADFNGDGWPDLLWQHQVDGGLVVWSMSGTIRIGATWLSPSASTDLNWKVVAVADFSGDSKPDLLWQHQITGGLVTWIMDGTTRLSARWLTPSASTDLNWKVVGSADFNFDGHQDLIWQNAISGQLIAWLMNGTTLATGQYLSPSGVTDPSWKVVAIR